MTMRSNVSRGRAGAFLLVALLTAAITVICFVSIGLDVAKNSFGPHDVERVIAPLGFGIATLFALEKMWSSPADAVPTEQQAVELRQGTGADARIVATILIAGRETLDARVIAGADHFLVAEVCPAAA